VRSLWHANPARAWRRSAINSTDAAAYKGPKAT
jgi:hypothetical protein